MDKPDETVVYLTARQDLDSIFHSRAYIEARQDCRNGDVDGRICKVLPGTHSTHAEPINACIRALVDRSVPSSEAKMPVSARVWDIGIDSAVFEEAFRAEYFRVRIYHGIMKNGPVIHCNQYFAQK